MMYRLSGIVVILAMLFMVLLTGCSNSGETVMPGQEPASRETDESISSHSTWGLWQFIADPEAGTLEYVEFRNALLHLNALHFLEPPPNLYLTLESPPQFSGNILTIDIGLRHPFLGLNQFTGFDVCGILIADATHHPYDDPDMLIGGDGDTWKGDWTEDTLWSNMPVGEGDYQCQTRTDFVSESSDGYIWLCWVNGNGFQVARRDPVLGTWHTQLAVADDKYDSPTIYIDNHDRVFVAVRYYVSEGENQVRLFIAEDGYNFDPDPLTIVSVPEARIDPCYLTLKGDAVDHLFLTFPYRPGDDGAYAAIIASKSGGLEWTDVCVLSDPITKHPGMAIRPDGSIEVGYGIPKNADPNSGSTDTAFSEMNYLHGRSHPGFIE